MPCHGGGTLCSGQLESLTVNALLLEGQVLFICLDVGGGGQSSAGLRSAGLHGARWARSGQLSAQRPASRARWASRRRGRSGMICPSGRRHRPGQLSNREQPGWMLG